MRRPSIARSLRVALVGLTIVLAALAAVGVAGLYAARQRYESTLTDASALATAAANLATASVVIESVAGHLHGPATAADRTTALAYRTAERRAVALAADDASSRGLVHREVTASSAAGALSAAAAVQNRQSVRERAAQAAARRSSRRDLELVAGAGAVALIGALGLVALLLRGLRDPLEELVTATRAMADGELQRRVRPDGPRELRELSLAFNQMGAELEASAARLERERSRLAVTIASLNDGLLVSEPETGRITTINPRGRDLLPALAPGDRVDGPGSPLPPLDGEGHLEATVEHGGRTLAVSATPLGGAGAGTVWTVRDMSEWARLDRAKAEFIATASHELRSPLTSIKGFVELLDRSPGTMSDRQREFVSIILRSTDRLVDLVNDLLDVARIDAAQMALNPRPVDVAAVLAELAELLGPRIAAKQQHLELVFAPALAPAYADPARLRQIVSNLLTNAHLYTQPGGRLRLAADTRGGRVRITVADDGPGIPADELEHLFDPFYRGSAPAEQTGSGLGLAIVRSLVELQDGTIDVGSEVGRGSTFRVTLPVARPDARELGSAIEALRGREVLIVDDEPQLAALIASQLQPFEVTATVALSGADALAQLRRRRFDAITMDVKMPGMDGLEVLEALRADPELVAIPVVFVSVASGLAELAGEWIVAKPVDAEELVTVLGTAVAMGRTRVLVVARERLAARLEPSLAELGVQHVWATSGVAAAQACQQHRFEVALIDVGLPAPRAVMAALRLRGRRRRRGIILFSDGETTAPSEVADLGLDVVPLTAAASSIAAVLETEPADPADTPSGR